MDRRGHEFRYILAAGFCGPGAVVLDAACGTGYGRTLLPQRIEYHGIDRDFSHVESVGGFLHECDIDAWTPDFTFDVFISFETLEHVQYPDHLISIGAQGRLWMIMSVPIVPTKHVNEFHLHDFKPGWLEEAMSGYPDWEHYQTIQQPSEVSEISVFGRAG